VSFPRITKTAPMAAVVVVASTVLAACHASEPSTSRAADGSCQWKPERDVTMVVPFDPGGGSDMFSRAVAQGLEQVRDGINVSVVNRTGGSGSIGYTYFYEQAGNPHFLLGADNGGLISLPLQQEALPYDVGSWTSVGSLVSDNSFLVVKSGSTFGSFEDFLKAAREADKAGDQLTVAEPAANSVDAIPLKSVLAQQGIKVEFVVFDGSSGAVPALLAGQVDGMFANPAEVSGQVEAGDFTPIVANSANSLSGSFRDVPSFESLGYTADGAFPLFRGIIAPPEVGECAQEYWVGALKDWVKTDDYKQYVDSNVLSSQQLWGPEWSDYLEQVKRSYQHASGS